MSNVSLVAALPRGGVRRGKTLRFTRVVLDPGEVCRIGRGFRRMRVVAGTAWLTCGGIDDLVEAGEGRTLPAARRRAGCAILSGLRGAPVVVELHE